MTKTTNTAEPVAAAADPSAIVTLVEFCTRLSETVRSFELIAGFEYTDKTAGNLKDEVVAYQARFDKFVKTPV